MCSKPNVNKRRGSGGNIVKEKLQRKKNLDELGFEKSKARLGLPCMLETHVQAYYHL